MNSESEPLAVFNNWCQFVVTQS